MEMSNEIRTLRDYFTLTDNEIVCDFCYNSYDIIVKNGEVEKHLKATHKGYENAVSSKSTQEDLKKYYTIVDNTIKCKQMHCEHLYISWNTHSILQYHLGDGHNTDEDKVKKFWEWIGEKYKLNDSDGEQYCNKCQTGIQNRPKQLIHHLTSHHEDKDCSIYKPSERLPNRLDNLFDLWIWNYYIRNGEYAYCSVCEKDSVKRCKYLRDDIIRQVEQHFKDNHKDTIFISLRSAKAKSKECDYCYIQDDKVKCKLCNTIWETNFNIQNSLENHLELKHKIKSNQSDMLRVWVFTHFWELTGFQKAFCKHCVKVYQNMCPYSLYEHLLKVHDIKMFTKYDPMGEVRNSCSLLRFGNVRNIFIPRINPQPGSNKPSGIEVRDVDCDRDNTMGNLKRKSSNSGGPSSSGENVISISSMSPQLGSYKSSDIEVRDVDCDRDNTMENLSRKSSNSGGPSSSGENVISISSMSPRLGSNKTPDIEDSDVDCDRDNTMGNLKRKSSNSGGPSSSGENVISISSMSPRLGSNKTPDIEDSDVDCDRDNTMGNLKRKSSNSGGPSSSGENVISISSMSPRLGSNKTPDIEDSDVDCDRDNTMGNLKRKLCSLSSSDKNVKDIGISSGEPQAGSSKDLNTDDRDSGMKKVKHDDDKRPLTDWPVFSEGIDPIRADLYENYIIYYKDSDYSDTSDI